MVVQAFYKYPGLNVADTQVTLQKLQSCIRQPLQLVDLKTELCFYVLLKDTNDLCTEDESRLQWLLETPFEEPACKDTKLPNIKDETLLIEIGPRLNFSTAFSTNAVSMCKSIGLACIERVEYATRYLLTFKQTGSGDITTMVTSVESQLVASLHDRMTQCRYHSQIKSFDLDINPAPVYEVDILTHGKSALEKANTDLGLAFDDWDIEYYSNLFTEKVQRNPTSVECFDLAQSNSEHSRHWFFKGRMVIDGEEKDESLFQMVMNTQNHSNNNNVIKFNDNSSGIEGFRTKVLFPEKTSTASSFSLHNDSQRHIIFTAETHNFPTGVAPFPGATTGTGGRIRDVHCTGRGANVVAGTAGYSFGNLNIPGYTLPWEDGTMEYPENFASPLQIAVEASNGASDYGNKFGEPVLTGFARSFGLQLNNGERREWVKPIMFSGGVGTLDGSHVEKLTPTTDMDVVKIGGPVYRIGVGGGAASSIKIQGDNLSTLDFGAVQRGDAEMEQKLNRVIRGCVEMREKNPICSIHDQGAGGNGNVLKEICEPSGAVIYASRFVLGDPTLSILELWGAEYQETNALLARKQDASVLLKLGQREKCPVIIVGNITNDGKIRLEDDRDVLNDNEDRVKRSKIVCPVDLELEHVLGKMPRKVFNLDHESKTWNGLSLPDDLTVDDALKRVLRLPSVASKRYLTNKVDRSVTGLVAQQQCVGPLHTPLADVAVIALSHFDTCGAATAVGEQPIKGLVDAGCGARMSVGEALTNLVFAPITNLKDVKCSGNWMWAAKLPGEGALLYDACSAMCQVMSEIGVAVDGGKDSLSMAARVGPDTIKAPDGSLVYVAFSRGCGRLGGSALAQCYGQIGDESPDLDDPDLFSKAFNVTQQLIKDGVLKAGHDVSDGGLVTCLLEMAFAGNSGISVNINDKQRDVVSALFGEELGIVVQVNTADLQMVLKAYEKQDVICNSIGSSHDDGPKSTITIRVNDELVLDDDMVVLRDVWEETSYQLERRQANMSCVIQEREGLKMRTSPPYNLTFDPEILMNTAKIIHSSAVTQPCVAIIREEGSNGDREMAAVFHMAGFETWDVNMQDLCTGSVTLDRFRGVVFVGGFSYADVCGSAKGWAATIQYNSIVSEQFKQFRAREDTFSLGICNGCQLMALLGWVGEETGADTAGVLLTHNTSGRFESRFTTVKIGRSPAVMLQGMEGSVLGVWVAHGEGRMVFKNKATEERLLSEDLVPLRYVDDKGLPTEIYPLNPNGSPLGVAGMCSTDGRHLALMPHPERCSLPWQWPWMPGTWQSDMKVAPWLCMFSNAHKWCMEH